MVNLAGLVICLHMHLGRSLLIISGQRIGIASWNLFMHKDKDVNSRAYKQSYISLHRLRQVIYEGTEFWISNLLQITLPFFSCNMLYIKSGVPNTIGKKA